MPQFFSTLPPPVFDIIGVAGFALYVLNYTMLMLHKVTSHSKTYFVINLFASLLVLIGMTHSFNLASALIQMFWIVISITAILVRLRPQAHVNTKTVA